MLIQILIQMLIQMLIDIQRHIKMSIYVQAQMMANNLGLKAAACFTIAVPRTDYIMISDKIP